MKVFAVFLVVAAGVLLGVEFTVRELGVPGYVLPPPSAVWLWSLEHWRLLAADAMTTGLEAAAGFAIALTLAFSSFVTVAAHQPTRAAFLGLSLILQAVPVLALAPFFSAWFGPGFGAKAAAAALVSWPVITASILSPLRNMPADEWAFAKSIFPGAATLTWRYLVPRALPGLLYGLRIAAPLAVLGAIVGEFVGASSGLGHRILTGSYYLRMPEMLAAVTAAVCMSLAAIGLVRAAEARFVFWADKRQ